MLRFENTGAPCVLHGYPGLDAVDASGKVVESAGRALNGYLGGLASGEPPTVTLATGQAASAFYEGANSPAPGRPCPNYTKLAVTPPDETRSVSLASPSNVCYLEIHPVVPGPTGNSRP